MLEATTAISGSTTAAERDFFAPSRKASSRRSAVQLKKAIIASCLCAVALGSLGALRHFSAIDDAADLPPTEASTAPGTPGSVLASLSPALPGTVQEAANEPAPLPDRRPFLAIDAQPVASSAPHLLPSTQNSAPAARSTRPPTPGITPVSAKSVDRIGDISRPLEIELGTKHSKDSPSTVAAPRKKLNGGKLIYGD
jgi:hypothetical protein